MIRQESAKNQVSPQDAECISKYIQSVWNENKLCETSDYLHKDYVDYSMPYKSFQNQSGLHLYLRELASKVFHKTEILDMKTMEGLIICQVKIFVTNRVDERGISHEIIDAYRIFGMCENKIIAHWEIL